jgi:TolB-like protein/Tfp pilus assembly protein PilF
MVPIEYPESVPETALEKEPEQREHSAGQISEQAARVQRRIKPDWWKTALLVASAVILVAVGYISWRHFRATGSTRSGKIRLAVLPFQNFTGDPNKEYLADGLTEETISQLGRLNPEQLGVIARTSVMGYKHKDVRLDQIGRDLSVQYVLENSLRESGDHLRLTAQLIQVKDQTHLWSQDYDYAAKDTLNVEYEVANAVAREIRVRLTSQQEDLARSRPVNPEAFDAFLQGYHFFQGSTDKDADTATKYFERATQLDPSYALAWAWLARARIWQANESLIPMEEGRQLAREAVERALSLNPSLAEAHVQMARIKLEVDYDLPGANASFQRAVALEPGNPEHVRLAALPAAEFGHFDEALQLNRQAIDLDPLNAGSWEALAWTEFFMGRLDQSAADSKKALEMNPDWDAPSWILLSRIYLMQGRPQDALPEIEHVHYAPDRAHLYALTYHALGRKNESDAALRELMTKYHASNAFEIATIYAFRNQADEAFEWLDRAYAQRDPSLMAIKLEPLLKSLHNDPRYAALLKKLNLPN